MARRARKLAKEPRQARSAWTKVRADGGRGINDVWAHLKQQADVCLRGDEFARVLERCARRRAAAASLLPAKDVLTKLTCCTRHRR